MKPKQNPLLIRLFVDGRVDFGIIGAYRPTVSEKVKLSQKILSVFLLTVLVSSLAVNSSASLPPERIQLPLPKPESTGSATKEQGHTGKITWTKHSVTIPKNGSLSNALDNLGVSHRTTYLIKKTKNGQFITNLRAGDKINIWIDQDKRLQRIYYPRSKTIHYELKRSQDKFLINIIERPVEIKIQTAAGVIRHSFYLSGKTAGLSSKTIMNLADIFSWEIDFVRQLRNGDPFKVIYEKKYIDGQYVGDGDILAAEIVTSKKDLHTAFLLRNEANENIGYYNHKYRNLRKAFLRNPVDYVRITSKFKPKRYHPVLKKWRAHRGIDYAGPVGTPIRATGDGQIIKRGWSKSYGRVIYIRHAGKYTTVYAHMSRYGKFKKGQWVRQGQVIGYIGSSGLATGPHLHYEFRKKGRHVDPLKEKFPDAGPVPKKYRQKFTNYAGLMQAQLERLNPHTQLASNFE